MKKKYKSTQKFEAVEVQPLVDRAKGLSTSFPSINVLSPDEAKEELMQRFLKLAKTILNPITTGRINTRSSFQKSFLKRFCTGKTQTNLQNMAIVLKKELVHLTDEEINLWCEIGIVEAIDKTKTNFVSTLVNVLATLVQEELNKLRSNQKVDLANNFEDAIIEDSFEASTLLSIDLKSVLTLEEMSQLEQYMTQDKGSLPAALKKKLKPLFRG